jgi:hypothetical protein
MIVYFGRNTRVFSFPPAGSSFFFFWFLPSANSRATCLAFTALFSLPG